MIWSVARSLCNSLVSCFCDHTTDKPYICTFHCYNFWLMPPFKNPGAATGELVFFLASWASRLLPNVDVQFGRHGVRLVLSENSALAPPKLNSFSLSAGNSRPLYQHPKISKEQRAWRWRARFICINKKVCVSNRRRNDASPHLFLIRVPAARPSYSCDTTPAVL